MEEQRKSYDFTNFKRITSARRKVRRISMTPINRDAYSRQSRMVDPVTGYNFTLEEIVEIIQQGDLETLRSLSRYFYRTNSSYRNNIDFLANLPLYDTVVIPLYQEGKGSEAQTLKAFYNACTFIDTLDVPVTFKRITVEWLISGIYNGILRQDGDKVIIQDLPIEYCRTRFKDFHNLNILEFNLQYFDHIYDEAMREEALATFPQSIQKAWRQYKNNTLSDPWVIIPSEEGGICFCFSGSDLTPPLIASIPDLQKLDDASNREQKRDENELYKLLIQRMPITSNGQLVFQLDEVADIHSSVADMLADTDTVDVLTTFGDTDLESLQDTSAATQAADRIAKYRKNAWNSLGRGEILFNPDGSSSLAYQIKKDESLMIAYLNVYESWIKFLLNSQFSRPNLAFDFEILSTTVFNRADLQKNYTQGALYGYSKMFAGVAMGIKQRDQISLMNFENDYLKMNDKMIPLKSSYTASNSENSNSSEKKTTSSGQPKNITNVGGRPELPDEEKSEKTQANIAAAG